MGGGGDGGVGNRNHCISAILTPMGESGQLLAGWVKWSHEERWGGGWFEKNGGDRNRSFRSYHRSGRHLSLLRGHSTLGGTKAGSGTGSGVQPRSIQWIIPHSSFLWCPQPRGEVPVFLPLHVTCNVVFTDFCICIRPIICIPLHLVPTNDALKYPVSRRRLSLLSYRRHHPALDSNTDAI